MKNFDLARELKLADEQNLRGMKFLLDNKINCVTSTSVGRIFDAVAADRLWKDFGPSDNLDWGKVLSKAQRGVPDALREIGFAGDAKTHPLCKAVLQFVAPGKTGDDVRKRFEAPPCGWTRDALDASLYVLLLAGEISALDAAGAPVVAASLERKAVSATRFRAETIVLTATQKIALRKLFASVFGRAVQAEELTALAPELPRRLRAAARAAGGPAPAPEPPSPDWLAALEAASGNAVLVLAFDNRAAVKAALDAWKAAADALAARSPAWDELSELSAAASSLPAAAEARSQVAAILSARRLLDEPDQLPPLAQTLGDLLRDRLRNLAAAYAAAKKAGEDELAADASWGKLDPDARRAVRIESGLLVPDGTGSHREPDPQIDIADLPAVLRTLRASSLSSIDNAIAALPGRYADAARRAAKRLEPKVRDVPIASGVLHDEAELDAWLSGVRANLLAELASGPVRVS